MHLAAPPRRSASTDPTESSATVMSTVSIGSSSATVDSFAASRSPDAAAFWKAMSEESTECAFPSTRVTRTSTIG